MAMKENRTKFNVSKDTSRRTYNSITFDSKIEMEYYRDVVLLQYESGEITHYELQKPYVLQPKFIHKGKTIRPIEYVADFFIQYKDGREVTIDTKGCPDSIAKMKRKMMQYIYPDLDYKWVCFSKIDGGWCDFEYVEKQRKERKKTKPK